MAWICERLLAYAHMLIVFDSCQVRFICMAFYTIHIVQKQLVNAYNVLISPWHLAELYECNLVYFLQQYILYTVVQGPVSIRRFNQLWVKAWTQSWLTL